MSNNEPDPIEQYRKDIDAAEKKVAREIDPGMRALVVAVGILALMATFALPHTGGAKGWDVLVGNDAALAEDIALPSRVFVWLTLVFGIVFGMLALVTRRWVLAWISVAGSAVASVFGMLAIWSRQTLDASSPGGGPGIGLILGWVLIMVLTFHWVHVVWQRTALQLAAEEERRRKTAEGDQNNLIWGDR
ncbi:Rv2732c family membrane protein [Rhodococcus sp. NPDC003348]